MDDVSDVGRPKGSSTCQFNPKPGRPAERCRKAARVKVTRHIQGQLVIAYRCWSHYLLLENGCRALSGGRGEIVVAEEVCV